MLDPKNAPTCKKCNTKSVLADAGVFQSIPYWYCRPCKKEVSDEGYSADSIKILKPSDKIEGQKLIGSICQQDPNSDQLDWTDILAYSYKSPFSNLDEDEKATIVRRFGGII